MKNSPRVSLVTQRQQKYSRVFLSCVHTDHAPIKQLVAPSERMALPAQWEL